MKKLKIGILWHQHQPYYKYQNEFMLPWVRLHGVKDYYDLPALLNNYPNVKQTFNLAPSLMMQIDDYINNVTFDRVQTLTRIKASELTAQNKLDIINNFFTLNYENLLYPNPRFRDLFDKCQNIENAMDNMQTQDWLDLQVWYNLAWIGWISRNSPIAKRLFQKGYGFTEEEKLILLDFHNEILAKITTEMAYLQKLRQIEISCSPMYHPILPLLIDSNSAKEAMPKVELPTPVYKYPEDAKHQIMRGIEYYEKKFNKKPAGMWPSEGSISNEALDMIAEAGIKWIACDEGVLAASMPDYQPTYKYFPHKIQTKNGELSIFFRDHSLSDKIGFTYSNWNSYDAACNFRESLLQIRSNIIANHGEEALDYAMVPVILDGENCWEFYYDNGIHFLNDFFAMLSNTYEIETVLYSDCMNFPKPDFLPKLDSIRAGSWINANFSIWIGHDDDRKAWNMLSALRQTIAAKKAEIPQDTLAKVMEEIYIAEGSDWFWWYGPEHNAPNKRDFDTIYRWRLTEIYKILGIAPPDELSCPVSNYDTSVQFTLPAAMFTPRISGKSSTVSDWEKSGIFYCNSDMSTMHQTGEIASLVRFGFDDEWIYFRVEFLDFWEKENSVELTVENEHIAFSLLHENDCTSCNSTEGAAVKFAFSDTFDIAIRRSHNLNKISFKLATATPDCKIVYPSKSNISFSL